MLDKEIMESLFRGGSRRHENYDFGIQNILLLNFFHFRIKEEADLLGLSENTVGKYRSNLGKTLGKDPISDWV